MVRPESEAGFINDKLSFAITIAEELLEDKNIEQIDKKTINIIDLLLIFICDLL